jgi:hypothetical protein
MKKYITIIIATFLFTVVFSSCSSSSHYQIYKGRVTSQKGTPKCLGAWGPMSPYNQRGLSQRRR